ncbi:hypothetical protein DITRI_Ditri19aG0124000 [Diplodiscus trichospermus]
MIRAVIFSLPLLFFFFFALTDAKRILPLPQPLKSFKINATQVYAPRIDDPYSRTFERCSTDTYQITGPCTYQVCYLYLYRSGYDGWKPESVTVSGYYTRSITFYYNTFIPSGIWYGFNYCNGGASASA